MERQVIQPDGRPRPPYPFSLGIRFGNLLFTAGAWGSDAEGKVPPDIRAQTRNTLENLRAVLAAGGSGLEHVLKATVFLTDIGEFAAMNEVYRTFFPTDPPARTTVGVAALARPEWRVEIDVVAAVPQRAPESGLQEAVSPR